jgi:porin
VNNPTIPFPDDALGVVIHAEPIDGWYASIGAADAQADLRETGFSTAFHDEDYFFAVAETGVVPTFNAGWGELSGAYRAGLWYDPQPKTDFTSGGTKRDDVGFYVSIDQQLLRENADDDQGLGVFARYGWADSDVNEITCFWSVGCQYQGLIPTRDQDVLGFGVARGKLVGSAGFSKQYETAYELYYGAWLAPWIQVAPSLQYIQDPGAAAGVSDAFVFGLRVQMAF